MKNAASVQNLTRKPRVLFTSFWAFILTCYFFHELETCIVPINFSHLLELPEMGTAEEGWKENKAPLLLARFTPTASPAAASLSQIQHQRGVPEQQGLGQVCRRGNLGCTQTE